MQDADVRRAAFDWLAEQSELYESTLPRSLLERGFIWREQRVPIVGPQGIFKPKVMHLPLSITTVADGPYADSFGPDGLLSYKYRGSDPNHRDNVGLRELMRQRIPLVYCHALVASKYVALWPVFVVADNPTSLTFSVAVDDELSIRHLTNREMPGVASSDTEAEIRRGYITTLAKRRIHQIAFRQRVISAYRQQCALCRLRHVQLLDAAHILPDSDPDGEPAIANGIALCKIHHAAFDKYFLSVRPDYVIQIRSDVLEERDGPMLEHGLQGLHEQRIQIPKKESHRPNQNLLDRRHQRFLEQALRPSCVVGEG
jgi:putative restriction endonuclease